MYTHTLTLSHVILLSSVDHSRICLQLGANDYINASLISVEEAQRNYILTQVSDQLHFQLRPQEKNSAEQNARYCIESCLLCFSVHLN